LEDGAAGGSQGGVPLRGVVPEGGFYRHQSRNVESSRGAVLQPAQYGGAVDQGSQAGGEDDVVKLPPFPLKPGPAFAEPAGLQPGQSLAAAGAAEEDRPLVADEFAAAAGEDGRAAGQTRPLLLAATGGRPSDATTLRQHGATACSFAGGSRMNAMEGAINLDVDAGLEERCLRNCSREGLSALDAWERTGVLASGTPRGPLAEPTLGKSSGLNGSRAHTCCDWEAKMEIPVKIASHV
jgi:hypothetical protein